jgi:hypothetical protein
MLTTALLTVRATSTESRAPTRLRMAARVTAPFGREGARGDGGRHGVPGVVETVGEVEGESDDDDQGQDEGCGGHGGMMGIP